MAEKNGLLDVFYKRTKTEQERRQRGIFALIGFVFVVVFTWMWVFHAQFVERNETERINVLIYAPARSGSSFLGQIFNQHDDVFYLYEPLYVYAILNKLRAITPSRLQHDSLTLLQDSIQCNFTNHQLYLYFISNPGYASPLFRDSSKAMSTPPLCSDKPKDNSDETRIWRADKKKARSCNNRLEPTKTTSVCQNHKQVTIKVLSHRIKLEEILKWISDLRKHNLKVIHLLRDPRAIIASRLRLGWISPKYGTMKIQEFCNRMNENLQFATNMTSKISKNYMLLRYEDLVENIFPTVRKIFKATNLDLKESVKKWLMEHTKWSGRIDTLEPFRTTKRNASRTANFWRRNISMSVVRTVEEKCKFIMKEAGYRRVQDMGELRKEHASLLVRPTEIIHNFLL